mmetsp:Transcript_4422/g.11418  ORF Transcript_4422/g.11418 Transcript_4422/m.11418 type:complete len:174 (+) Transcript_4422:1192-1713(+)
MQVKKLNAHIHATTTSSSLRRRRQQQPLLRLTQTQAPPTPSVVFNSMRTRLATTALSGAVLVRSGPFSVVYNIIESDPRRRRENRCGAPSHRDPPKPFHIHNQRDPKPFPTYITYVPRKERKKQKTIDGWTVMAPFPLLLRIRFDPSRKQFCSCNFLPDISVKQRNRHHGENN